MLVGHIGVVYFAQSFGAPLDVLNFTMVTYPLTETLIFPPETAMGLHVLLVFGLTLEAAVTDVGRLIVTERAAGEGPDSAAQSAR